MCLQVRMVGSAGSRVYGSPVNGSTISAEHSLPCPHASGECPSSFGLDCERELVCILV